jgi:hypothetical protein
MIAADDDDGIGGARCIIGHQRLARQYQEAAQQQAKK